MPFFNFEFQYAADTLVDTFLCDFSILYCLNYGLKCFDEVLWTKNDISRSRPA